MAKEWDPCPYTPDVLIGNWNEERFDAKEISQGQSLPSPHDHYFQTTYKHAYSKSPREVPHVLKYPEKKEPNSFPGHQPELDTPQLKADYNAYVTASMEAYGTTYYSLKKKTKPISTRPKNSK